MPTIFLGGTCNQSTWRANLIPLLRYNYFNPVVEDWSLDAQEEERVQRKNCDIVLYTITPKMTGVYSIAEVIDDANKRPEKTVVCLLEEDDGYVFSNHQLKSMKEVCKMVKRNGGKVFHSLEDVALYVNHLPINENELINSTDNYDDWFIIDPVNLTINVNKNLPFNLSDAVIYSVMKTVWKNEKYYKLPYPIECIDKDNFCVINGWTLTY